MSFLLSLSLFGGALLGLSATLPAAPSASATQAPAGAAASSASGPSQAAPRPDASAVWNRLVEAARGPGRAEGPVTGVEIEADVRARQASGQSNDIFEPRFRYLAPGYVRVSLGSDRETGKGPAKRSRDGYWARDKEQISSLKGREFATDRDEIDQILAINRMLLILIHPEQLEAQELALLPRQPSSTQERSVGRKLDWITLRTDRLGLSEKPSERTVQQVTIGVDPTTGQPRQAFLIDSLPEELASKRRIELQPTRFFAFDDFQDAQGFSVPRKIRVYDLDPAKSRPKFREQPTLDVVVKHCNLRPELTPEMFLPNS